MRSNMLIALVFLFITAVLSGCASNQAVVWEKPKPDYVYYPRVSQGQSMEGVKQDLAKLLGTTRSPGIKYFGRQGINNTAGEAELRGLVTGKSGTVTFWYDNRDELLFMSFSHLSLLSDSIVVTPQISFSFNELQGTDIVVKVTGDSASWGRHVSGKNLDGISRPYKIHFPGLMSFMFEYREDAEKFADDLYFIQKMMQKPHDDRRARFDAKVSEYRKTMVKPAVSEEQRKYIVQADALNQNKEYARALELYEKAVDVDPISYPGAYFNMALLAAQMNRYQQAIAYMKQYLDLDVQAKDVRSAQDKIYEWEILSAGKP